MYLLFYIEGKTKKRSSKWLEGVDINIRTNFGTKVVFRYLFCQLEIQIV